MLRSVRRLHRGRRLRDSREVLDVTQCFARASHTEETSVLRHICGAHGTVSDLL